MYFLQYTSGEAKKTIKSCLVMDFSVGYQTARKLLEERFGHPFTIASTYVAKLTEEPPLKPSDRTGLLAFVDQLKDCERTLESIGDLDEINSADNSRRILQRLPFHLRSKFFEVADSIQQSGKRTNISHIAEFVKVKSRAVNNPVFGSVIDAARQRADDSRRRSKPRGGPSPVERATTLSTQVTNPSRKENAPSASRNDKHTVRYGICSACNRPHFLSKCQMCETKSFEERLQIMRRSHLCHNCFKYGHIAVGCLAKSACQVDGSAQENTTPCSLHPPTTTRSDGQQASRPGKPTVLQQEEERCT